MKLMKVLSPKHFRSRRVQLIILFVVSLLGTLLGGKWLFRDSLVVNISSTIINIGLDPQRTQLVVALLMTAGSALIGALLGRRKAGSVVGAGIVFWFGYLANFIQVELQPLRDPGGRLEPLNGQALLNTSITMMALALLGAFIGAAVGIALAEVLLDPLYNLLLHIWQYFTHRRLTQQQTVSVVATHTIVAPDPSRTDTILKFISQWFGVIVIVGLLILATTSGDLFTFAPDVGLHTLPDIHPIQGKVAHGPVIKDVMVSPTLNGQHRNVLVYLPPSYNTSAGQTKRYPVLYLLHGSPGTDIDWITGGKASESADTLMATNEIPEFILVLPDGNGRPKATSEWADSFDHRQLLETFLVKDLVQYIDLHYRTIPDVTQRAIGGLSMGGFGAMNIAVHHPDIFTSVISLGGYYYAEGSIWGKNAAYMQKNSPAIMLPKIKAAWKLHMYLGAATKDQPYYTDTTAFLRQLNTLHIPYHFDLQRGYHSWRVWQIQMYNAMLWLKWG